MKAVVATLNQEKALVGVFSVIIQLQTSRSYVWISSAVCEIVIAGCLGLFHPLLCGRVPEPILDTILRLRPDSIPSHNLSLHLLKKLQEGSLYNVCNAF